MTENVIVEPAYITAGKQRVQGLEAELASARASLQQDITDWKSGLDAGFSIEKDAELSDVLAAKARLEDALAAAEEKLALYEGAAA